MAPKMKAATQAGASTNSADASDAAKPAQESPTATSAVPAASAAPKPRKFLSLSHLNQASAPIGLWEVAVCNPKATSREYLWEGRQRKTYQFQCHLVSTKDPTLYVLADSHGKGIGQAAVSKLAEKFKHGLVFTMSKVVLAENVKRQYNSAPKTEVVCMTRTHFDPVLVTGPARMPEPAVPIAASMSIGCEQVFDGLALIYQISESAPGGQLSTGQRRVRITLDLIDGSTSAEKPDTPIRMPLTVFENEMQDGSEPPLFKQLREAYEKKKAVAFFHIQGKKAESDNGSTWNFQSGFSFSIRNASETAKGKDLEAKAHELLAANTESVPQTVLKSRLSDDSSYADKEATETTCALLNTILTNTNLATIEVDASFWQINWCRVCLPDSKELCNSDGNRLWFLLKVEDETGSISLFIREKAALSLAALDTKEEFENAVAMETLRFPDYVSIKIIRKSPGPKTPIAKTNTAAMAIEDGQREQEDTIRCYIVEAADQMQFGPSKRSLELMPLLSMTDAQTDACAPAVLAQITKHPHSGLCVTYAQGTETITKQCTKAVALVVASTPTEAEMVNDGYQMTTHGVQDPLTSGFNCQLLSFCTVKASPDYQLKPNRGQKTQAALVTIVDVFTCDLEDHPVFLVDDMKKVEDADIDNFMDLMKRRLEFSAQAAKTQGTSSQRIWTEEVSPAHAGKCKRLGKAPSTPLEEKPVTLFGA